MSFRVTIEDGRYVRTLEVRSGRVVAGSSPGCKIVLTSEGVARRHSVLRQAGDRVLFECLPAGARVRVGERLEARAEAAPGDTVGIGGARIRVLDLTPEPAAPQRPAAGAPAGGETEAAAVPKRRDRRFLAVSVLAHVLLLAVLSPWALLDGRAPPPGRAELTLETSRAMPEIAPEETPDELPDPFAQLPRPAPPVPVEPPEEERDLEAPPDFTSSAPEPQAAAESVVAFQPAAVGLGGRTGERLGDSFGKSEAGRANRSAAGALRGDVGARAVLNGLGRRLTAESVKVLSAHYDPCARVLDALGLPYSPLTAEELARAVPGPGVLVVFYGCHGEALPEAAQVHLAEWVHRGGFLVTTDWGIERFLAHRFPGYLRPLRDGSRLVVTEDRTVACRATGAGPLVRGFPRDDEPPYWWLDESSIPFEVADPAAVEVLVTSEELLRLHGSSNVAATFAPGRGRVLHLLCHVFQEEGNLRGAVTMQRLVVNFLVESVRDR